MDCGDRWFWRDQDVREVLQDEEDVSHLHHGVSGDVELRGSVLQEIENVALQAREDWGVELDPKLDNAGVLPAILIIKQRLWSMVQIIKRQRLSIISVKICRNRVHETK